MRYVFLANCGRKDPPNPETAHQETPLAYHTGNGRLLVKHFVTEFFLNPMSVVFFTYQTSFLYKKTVSL
jgi:hypothetical protein